MGQLKHHPDRQAHGIVRTPTGDARMDADQRIRQHHEPDSGEPDTDIHRAGLQQADRSADRKNTTTGRRGTA